MSEKTIEAIVDFAHVERDGTISTHSATVRIELAELARVLGRKALHSKQRRAILGNGLIRVTVPMPPICADARPWDDDPRRFYRCRLTAGHEGDHVDTKHPMHPSWRRA